ncbi:unnamed protein product [Fraxinus pennsylvanica]|uniref:Reverse transcriptase zinc-binding domain-containing protein n=1 Tax=Fraxinus pennsylvanica TaxID=56036 RepID=A0AAD2ECD1_9LAMI|nr:unnamed protein product [Fraxinus pennsylvanica]
MSRLCAVKVLGSGALLWNAFLRGRQSCECYGKVSKCREGNDVLIWKPSSQGTFSSKSAWEMIRVRYPQTPWGRWVWHSALPKRMSVIMWKAFSGALSVDNKVRQMGVALASSCDCCLTGMEETASHVLSTGEVENEVWRKVSVALGIRWRTKQNWELGGEEELEGELSVSLSSDYDATRNTSAEEAIGKGQLRAKLAITPISSSLNPIQSPAIPTLALLSISLADSGVFTGR